MDGGDIKKYLSCDWKTGNGWYKCSCSGNVVLSPNGKYQDYIYVKEEYQSTL